jgi:Flp pilus assembly protein TadD
MHQLSRRAACSALLTIAMIGLAACTQGGISASGDGLFAPGIDLRGESADSLEVAHRLVEAGEYELALRAFNRAALEQGSLDAEILSGLGSANLGLGRLGQAETLLRRAVKEDSTRPEIWNNLGVVLMETGHETEAEQIFRKAYALDNGESDAIRDNLRLAIAKTEKSGISEEPISNFKLVRRGSSDYLLRSAS